jgi:hypothetical protein
MFRKPLLIFLYVSFWKYITTWSESFPLRHRFPTFALLSGAVAGSSRNGEGKDAENNTTDK